MAIRVTAAGLGVVFGFLLAWVGFSDPDAIRRMLLLEEAYLFLVFFAALATAFAGACLVRRARVRAVLTGEPVVWSTGRPQRRHVAGSIVFGAGWALSSACPGPIAVQAGQGMAWSAFTIAGVVLGLVLFNGRDRVRDAVGSGPLTRQAQGR